MVKKFHVLMLAGKANPSLSVLPQRFLGESTGSGAITEWSGRCDTEKSPRGQSLMKEPNAEKYTM